MMPMAAIQQHQQSGEDDEQAVGEHDGRPARTDDGQQCAGRPARRHDQRKGDWQGPQRRRPSCAQHRPTATMATTWSSR